MFKEKAIFYFFACLIVISMLQYNSNCYSLKKKFSDRCEDMLTCDSCLQMTSSCGWCYSDGLCKSGNEIGPSTNTCKYSNWETSKCNRRECNSYDNILSCVTQKDCYWCKNENVQTGNIEGKCNNRSKQYEIECKDTNTLESYVKSPNIYKNKIKNTFLNAELQKLSNHDMYKDNSDSANEAQFLKYEKFMGQLKTWMNTNKKKEVSVYDSVNNPAGVYSYQIDKSENNFNKTESIILDMGNFNTTDFQQLSKKSKSTIVGLSKKLATTMLSSMFNFKNGVLSTTSNYQGAKYYMILESIGSEEWEDFVRNKGYSINDIYKVLQIDKSKLTKSVAEIIKQVYIVLIIATKTITNLPF